MWPISLQVKEESPKPAVSWDIRQKSGKSAEVNLMTSQSFLCSARFVKTFLVTFFWEPCWPHLVAVFQLHEIVQL